MPQSLMEILIRKVLKLQNSFVVVFSKEEWSTEAAIKDIKTQLEASLGASMS